MDGDARTAAYLERLHELAEVSIDLGKPLRLYIRSAETVYRQACIYKNEDDLEKSFILFLKYSNLVLKELPKHPEYKSQASQVGTLRGNLLPALDLLEQCKPVLLRRFREVEAERLRMAQREAELELARRREAEARAMAERALRSQESARQAYSLNNNNNTSIPLASQETLSSSPPSTKGTSLIDGMVSMVPEASPSKCFRLENGMPLRMVRIPQSIIDTFSQLAAPNTRRNLETCGVLAGRLSHDQFTITTLIIPRQTATSDTVAMLGEEEIFAVQDERDLMTLGWIHTHPTQQCFMSSVDLHTHFPYQLLMAEAVAIVVAPTRTPNFGIFRLTDPPGISTISQCPQRGFHHHPCPDGQIYREISGPEGHAKMLPSLSLEIVDLRPDNKT